MKKNGLKFAFFLLSITIFSSISYADGWRFFSHKEVKNVSHMSYTQNCSECHFAYQPGLLPARSWQKLLEPKMLEDHFGENAEFDEEDRKLVLVFLTQYAADKSLFKRSIKIARSLADDEVPLRISDVKYIKRKHHEIPDRMIQGNPKVRSMMNCQKCHTQASKGIYDDDTVFIPGFGEWDD